MVHNRLDDVGVEGTLAAPNVAMLKRLIPSIRSALKRNWPELQEQPVHARVISIVAGGPNAIEFFKHEHKEIMCVNQAHDWLLERQVLPDSLVVLDNDPSMAKTIDSPHPDIIYYCASMTAPELLDRLEGYKTVLWHCRQECGEEEAFNKDVTLIGGGNNVGLRAISIAHYLGYRTMNCFGFCGSMIDNKFYAYDDRTKFLKTEGYLGMSVLDLTFNGQTFRGTKLNAIQSGAFWQTLINFPDCKIRAYGEGMIPAMSKAFENKEWESTSGKNAPTKCS